MLLVLLITVTCLFWSENKDIKTICCGVPLAAMVSFLLSNIATVKIIVDYTRAACSLQCNKGYMRSTR